MDAASLKNQTIVAVSGAEKLGTVNEILFETDPLRVAALKATDANGDFVVPFERVRRFGPDAVMVESADVRTT
ncbi:MAG TPA: PRC-barrel domain-containing protein, partial [Mycobacteriales bacterium]|nr:PRC-barrel domain-containing protein [Mycobacteriales bacterium]